MNIKIILIILILLGFVSQAGLCQTDRNFFVTNETDSEPLLSGELFNPTSTPDIVTYFNKDWLSGEIWLTNGRIARNKKIKYNGLLDELFCIEPVSNLTIKLDKEAILQFHFLNFQGDTTIRFRKIKVKKDISNDSSDIFVQEIFNGNLALFILHTCYFAGMETVRINKGYFLKEAYKKEPVYYLRSPDNRIVEFKRFSRRILYSFMPDKKDQIRKYFRDSISGKIKTDQEIKSFIQFLSSIVE